MITNDTHHSTRYTPVRFRNADFFGIRESEREASENACHLSEPSTTPLELCPPLIQYKRADLTDHVARRKVPLDSVTAEPLNVVEFLSDFKCSFVGQSMPKVHISDIRRGGRSSSVVMEYVIPCPGATAFLACHSRMRLCSSSNSDGDF